MANGLVIGHHLFEAFNFTCLCSIVFNTKKKNESLSPRTLWYCLFIADTKIVRLVAKQADADKHTQSSSSETTSSTK